MFESTHPFVFFEYFRTPYRVVAGGDSLAGCGCVRRTGTDRAIYWPEAASVDLPPARRRIGDVAIFGPVVSSAAARDLLVPGWEPLVDVRDDDGGAVASVWTDGASIFLPFDPSATIVAYWSERYDGAAAASVAARAKRVATRAYYRVRPALPRRLQIEFRRVFARVQARTRFPRWPVETSLHDLYDLLFGWVARVAGEPVPWLAPWPRGYSWALVLTHDVEQELGYRNLHLLRDIERSAGYRSSWNFVPRRSYTVEDGVVEDLLAEGFEVGVHGLYHDGRDLESLEILRERLPEMREYAKRWRAAGFRSPATHRDWDLMPLLGFDYDSSYLDTDPFEPIAGGCCSWLPFFIGDLVELPITTTQDYVLFVVLQRDETLWVEKTEFLRERGGMSLVITHPDYMLEQRLLDAYRRFLERYRDDPNVWTPLPREVAAWWRRRAASTIERDENGWRIAGPAADEAALRLAQADH